MNNNIEKVYTVTEITKSLKKLVEENFSYLLIQGEVSNYKKGPTGHIYFTIKDDDCQIRAVMWSSRVSDLTFVMKDGINVIVKGRITLYPTRGEYQVEAWDIRKEGYGELQQKFEQLKQKLFEEGLFDEGHKKPLPMFPENVALITSKTGAVFHDFVNIVKRRYPILNIFLFSSQVQGNKAAEECLESIDRIIKFNKLTNIDIIVIARGGGSFEDLFCFNDEKLARAIYKCKIPVVSAIGHDVDFTICDFVADKRASTPSAAAELITPLMSDLIEKLDDFSYFCKGKVEQKIKDLYSSVKEIESNYYFKRPKDIINNFYQRLDEMSKNATNLTKSKVSNYQTQLKHISKTLYHISPEINLKKGYAVIYEPDVTLFNNGKQRILTRSNMVKKNSGVEIKFYDGKRKAKID